MLYSEVERKTVIAKRIKEERGLKGLTQEALAKKIHCSKPTVVSWERPNGANRVPDNTQLAELTGVFGCDVGYLLGDQSCRTKVATDIHDKTGLSEEAIYYLQSLQEHRDERTYYEIEQLVQYHILDMNPPLPEGEDPDLYFNDMVNDIINHNHLVHHAIESGKLNDFQDFLSFVIEYRDSNDKSLLLDIYRQAEDLRECKNTIDNLTPVEYKICKNAYYQAKARSSAVVEQDQYEVFLDQLIDENKPELLKGKNYWPLMLRLNPSAEINLSSKDLEEIRLKRAKRELRSVFPALSKYEDKDHQEMTTFMLTKKIFQLVNAFVERKSLDYEDLEPFIKVKPYNQPNEKGGEADET